MAGSERVAGWFLVGIFISACVVLVLAVAQDAAATPFQAPPIVLGLAFSVVIAAVWVLIRLIGHSFPVPAFHVRHHRPHPLFTPLYDQR